MTTLVLETDPAAGGVTITDDQLIVNLVDGRILSVPLAWYPRLQHATVAERQNVHLLGEGYAMEWPELDEQLGLEGLLAGRRSGESPASFQRWLAAQHSSERQQGQVIG